MKTKLSIITISLLVIVSGIMLGRSFASETPFVPLERYTLLQEVRDSSGNLIANDLVIYDHGRRYYCQTNLKGEKTILVNTERGGWRNHADENDPARLVKTKDTPMLWNLADHLRVPSGWSSYPNFQGFAKYQGWTVVHIKDENGEQWLSPELFPTPLRAARSNGQILETVEFKLGEADLSVFEVNQ